MRIRSVLKEFEAHLRSVQPDSNIAGKSEWKRYGDGTLRMKISVRNIPLPDDAIIDVLLEGKRISQISVQNNRIKLDVENTISIGVPSASEGNLLQIQHKGTVLAEGIYHEE